MKLTVVIVSYNVRYYLEQCIISVIRATTDMQCEIYVVDNNSDDGTIEYLHARFGDSIVLIECQHNLGFARANNIAIRQSSGEYVLLLNPDTIVAETAIKTALQFMEEHEKVGGVGIKMYNADGTVAPESRRALPTPLISLKKMLGFSKRYYMSHLSWDQPGRIEVMSGAFLMVRRNVLHQVGMLDKDFFMYGEDIDLSCRIIKGGYENWYVPANMVHYKGESTQKTSYRYVHVFYEAMLIFFRKHYSHLSFFVTLPIKMAIYFRAFIALIQMLYRRLHDSLGFHGKQADEVSFLFKGSKKTLNGFTKLARRKGLMLTNDSTSSPLCIVYDTSSYTYEQIIEDMTHYPHAQLGTYYYKTNILITSDEIFK